MKSEIRDDECLHGPVGTCAERWENVAPEAWCSACRATPQAREAFVRRSQIPKLGSGITKIEVEGRYYICQQDELSRQVTAYPLDPEGNLITEGPGSFAFYATPDPGEDLGLFLSRLTFLVMHGYPQVQADQSVPPRDSL